MTLKADIIIWFAIDLTIILIAISGNLLTLFAIILCRKLSGLVSNYLVFSLALSDLLVGIAIPYHFLFSVGIRLSSNKQTCILRFILVVFACSSSIYNLLAIATDRYIAIVHPLHYNKYMTKKIVSCLIIFGWIFSLSCAAVIIFWNNWKNEYECTLDHVIPSDYLTFVLTPMFLSVWLAVLMVYVKIWTVAAKQVRRIKKETNCNEKYISDSKSVQVVMLILGCFSICWLPYFIVVTTLIIVGGKSGVLYEITFTLAMANSCMNPIIYAWKNSSFRDAFWCMMRCKSPQLSGQRHQNFVTNHTPIDSIKSATLNSNCKSDTTSNHTEIEMYDAKSQVDYKDWDQEATDDTAVTTGSYSVPR